MKPVVRAGLLAVVVLALAACGSANGAEPPAADSRASPVPGAGTGAFGGVELTDEMRLMLGTLKLDEVGLAPDAAQAADLLVLWQAYRSLATSDTAAEVELEAVVNQVRKAMTQDQLEAIDAMDLDDEDLSVFLEEFRSSVAEGEPGAGRGFFFQGGGGGGAAGGGPPGGGPDGQFFGGPPGGAAGGGPFINEGGGGPGAFATAQAGGAIVSPRRGGLFLLGPLIAELQALAAG